MSTDTTITRQLDNGTNKETALKNLAGETLAQLKARFGNQYAVTADDFGEIGKNWSHEIKVRNGSKIGAAVTLKWEQTNPGNVSLDVEESSKLGTTVIYTCLLLFTSAGVLLAYNDMAPLAFLPGKKLAGLLGALISIIPGGIIGFVLKNILLKNEKEQNAKLVAEVRQFISN